MIYLDHVHIFSSDVEKTIHFYTTMFDARVVYDTPLVGKRNVRLDIGSAQDADGTFYFTQLFVWKQ